MVLVAATHRRLGLGTALFGRCLDACAEQGLLAGLDATELGRPVYERLGFVDVLALRRWRLERPVSAPAAGAGLRIASVSPADLAAVAAFDAARSGMHRPAILAHLATRGPGFVARDAEDALAGYVLSRNGRTAMQVGPIVARDAATARALLAAATSAGAAGGGRRAAARPWRVQPARLHAHDARRPGRAGQPRGTLRDLGAGAGVRR